MLKQLFKKLQKKIPISIEIKHFLFLLYYSTKWNVFEYLENIFRKLIKFSFIFCIQNKNKCFGEKMFAPESKFAWAGSGWKKVVNFGTKLKIFFLKSTHHGKKLQN